MIDIKTLKKTSNERDEALALFIDALDKKIRNYQKNIVNSIIDDVIYNDIKELEDVIVEIEKIVSDNKQTIALLAWYKKEIKNLLDLTEEYFDNFDRNISENTKNNIDIFLAAFVGTLTSFKGDLVSSLTTSVLSDTKPFVKAESFKKRILGTKNRGLIYNKLMQPMRDTAIQILRYADLNTAKQENLDYAFYTGLPLSEKSRCFCIERKDKFFSLDTINSWNDLSWAGKIDGVDVKLQTGGYNCVHHLLWVDEETAEKYGVTEEVNPCE